MQAIYVLSCEAPEKGGGIYRYELTEAGKLSLEKMYPCDRPMYAVKEKDGLRVLLRQPFAGNKNGGCFSIDFDLKKATDIRSTQGIVPCHLCADGEDCYTVNYLSGNLVNVGKKLVTHQGKGANALRQDAPHTHCALFSPDRQYVLCCDLGLDTLFCYDRELKLISSAKIADGYGLRHAVFSKDGKYVYAVSEMVPAIHIFSFEGGMVALKGKMEIPCAQEKADGAAIRLSKDGRKLYVSLRVENALATYAVEGEELRLLQKIACGGDSPRDFDLTDEYLVVTNERSNDVAVFAMGDGLPLEKVESITLPAPLCVVK